VSEVHDRLVNWGRAMRVKPRPGHCVSIEHRWRSPQRDHWLEQAPPTRLGPPDLDDAWCVESAWATLELPYRIVLRSHYCLQLPPVRVRRLLRSTRFAHTHDYGVLLVTAEFHVKQALGEPLERNRNTLRRIVRAYLDQPPAQA
jgi:hypothetical protein